MVNMDRISKVFGVPYRMLLRPRTKISKREARRLKQMILKRLRTENYTCRISRPPKPRIRYQLRLRPHSTFTRWGRQWEYVYK